MAGHSGIVQITVSTRKMVLVFQGVAKYRAPKTENLYTFTRFNLCTYRPTQQKHINTSPICSPPDNYHTDNSSTFAGQAIFSTYEINRSVEKSDHRRHHTGL